LAPVDAQFGPAIHLTGFWLDSTNPYPGTTLPILLEWRAGQPLPADYTVFIHLLAPDGTLVAQHDAYPTWLTPQPTSRWPAKQSVIDQHTLDLPTTLAPDTYTLEVGLYNTQTMERLSLPDGHNAFFLTQLAIK
jgi:hypothetical protein